MQDAGRWMRVGSRAAGRGCREGDKGRAQAQQLESTSPPSCPATRAALKCTQGSLQAGTKQTSCSSPLRSHSNPSDLKVGRPRPASQGAWSQPQRSASSSCRSSLSLE